MHLFHSSNVAFIVILNMHPGCFSKTRSETFETHNYCGFIWCSPCTWIFLSDTWTNTFINILCFILMATKPKDEQQKEKSKEAALYNGGKSHYLRGVCVCVCKAGPGYGAWLYAAKMCLSLSKCSQSSRVSFKSQTFDPILKQLLALGSTETEIKYKIPSVKCQNNFI